MVAGYYSPYLPTTLLGLVVFCLTGIFYKFIYQFILVSEYGFWHEPSSKFILDYQTSDYIPALDLIGYQNYCFSTQNLTATQIKQPEYQKPFTEIPLSLKSSEKIHLNLDPNSNLNYCKCTTNCYIEYSKNKVTARGCDTSDDPIFPGIYSNVFFWRFLTLRKVTPCGLNSGLSNYDDPVRLDLQIINKSLGFIVKNFCYSVSLMTLLGFLF